MYKERQIALVIPAYREEKLIASTLRAAPSLIDRIYVVDDASPDRQNDVILGHAKVDPRVRLLKHAQSQGPGGAIISGYLQAAADQMDIVVVVGGDNQMDLSEVSRFLDPLIEGRADYAKGNRFMASDVEETLRRMPKLRLVANWIITGLAKTASGYFKIMDVVDGYTAISRSAIETINWKPAWKKYGYPMDFLVRLNAYGFRVVDVPRRAIYLPGERQSQIRGLRYFLTVTPMLVRDFFWRLRFKYLYRDFHPVVFFYLLAMLLIPPGFFFGLYLLWDKISAHGYNVSAPRAILVALALISGFQFLLFAMLFEMQND